MSTPTRFRFFLAALAVVGSFFVWLATSHYGPGLSTDGARYLSTAENIAHGQGIIDYLGLPLINWPPLYSIVLAIFNRLTGLDVFVIGQWLNILAFGLIIWFSGIFFEHSLPQSRIFPVLGSLIVATSLPLIEVSANIASDPLFMVCTLLFLLAAQDYLRSRKKESWWQMVVLTILACFLRYAGLALVIAGAVIVFLAHRKKTNQAIFEAAAFGAVSGAPIAAWAVFHNYTLTGSILGAHLPAYPWGLFVAWIEKTFSWFVPESITKLIPPLILLVLFILLIALRSTRARWAAFSKRLQEPGILPSVLFFVVYGLMLIFAISYPEHRGIGSQRIHAVLLPVLLVLVAVMVQEFLPRLPRKPRFLQKLALAAFAIWMLFPIYRVAVYVNASMQNGDVSFYNIYNTRTLRESDIVAQIGSMQFAEDEKVYSNNEGAAWFYLRRRIYRLPRYDPEVDASLEQVMTSFDGWPAANETSVLIWFKRDLDYKELVPTPEAMQVFIRLTPVFTGRYGIVYLMDVDLAK